MKVLLLVLLAFSADAWALDTSPEIVEFRVYPGQAGKDSISICIDLGEKAFSSVNAQEFCNQNLRVTFGELDLRGKTGASALINEKNLKVALSENGKKLKIEASEADLGFLLDPQPQPGTIPVSCELKISFSKEEQFDDSARVLFVRKLFLKFEKEINKTPSSKTSP